MLYTWRFIKPNIARIFLFLDCCIVSVTPLSHGIYITSIQGGRQSCFFCTTFEYQSVDLPLSDFLQCTITCVSIHAVLWLASWKHTLGWNCHGQQKYRNNVLYGCLNHSICKVADQWVEKKGKLVFHIQILY